MQALGRLFATPSAASTSSCVPAGRRTAVRVCAHKVKIATKSGEVRELEVPDGTTILEAALDAGENLGGRLRAGCRTDASDSTVSRLTLRQQAMVCEGFSRGVHGRAHVPFIQRVEPQGGHAARGPRSQKRTFIYVGLTRRSLSSVAPSVPQGWTSPTTARWASA